MAGGVVNCNHAQRTGAGATPLRSIRAGACRDLFRARGAGGSGRAGYRGFWMGYFAARSAPLGIVPRELVTAIFYNFAPERVAKALPAAWEVAGPEAACVPGRTPPSRRCAAMA